MLADRRGNPLSVGRGAGEGGVRGVGRPLIITPPTKRAKEDAEVRVRT